MADVTNEQPDVQQGKAPKTGLIFLVFPLLGILFGLALALADAGNHARPATTSEIRPLMNWPAPLFELESLDGETVRLSGFQGRPVFVNFWATWCEPCTREFPAFETFLAQQGPDGATILAVNSDEPVDAIRAFLLERNVGALPVLLDPGLAVRNRFAVFNLPTTFLIDEEGTVRAVKYGEMTTGDLNAYLDQLRRT